MSGRSHWPGWTLIAVLAVGLVWASWGTWEAKAASGGTPRPSAEGLEERVEEYARLRIAEDWVTLYEMVDPAHRKLVDLRAFLDFYGHGVLKTHGIEVLDVAMDEGRTTASVRLRSDGELVVGRLPAQYRAGFRTPEDRSALRRTVEHDMRWTWHDGWHYQLEEAIVARNRASQPESGGVR